MIKHENIDREKEMPIVREIVIRYFDLTKSDSEFLDVEMDVCACHCNCDKLDLKGLLEADNTNFLHDLCGIRENLNRDDIVLENCFRPRFALPTGGK